MPAVQNFLTNLSFDHRKFSQSEAYLFEAALFLHICCELKEFFRERYKNYFQLINISIEMEDKMLDENHIRLIIQDILLSEDYTLPGIAYYTQTPEEVVCDIISGSNIRPSAVFLQKIIELHRFVRRDLYKCILQKILNSQLDIAS